MRRGRNWPMSSRKKFTKQFTNQVAKWVECFCPLPINPKSAVQDQERLRGTLFSRGKVGKVKDHVMKHEHV